MSEYRAINIQHIEQDDITPFVSKGFGKDFEVYYNCDWFKTWESVMADDDFLVFKKADEGWWLVDKSTLIETRKIEVDISDEDFLMLAKKAHENDLAINQLCIKILKEQIKKE